MNYLEGKKDASNRDLKWAESFDFIIVGGNKPSFLLDEKQSLSLKRLDPYSHALQNVDSIPSGAVKLQEFLKEGKFFQVFNTPVYKVAHNDNGVMMPKSNKSQVFILCCIENSSSQLHPISNFNLMPCGRRVEMLRCFSRCCRSSQGSGFFTLVIIFTQIFCAQSEPAGGARKPFVSRLISVNWLTSSLINNKQVLDRSRTDTGTYVEQKE